MISSTWKGFAAGLGLFLALTGVTLLTPARVPALKALGRDHAALRLEQRIVAALPAETPAAELKARSRSLDNRSESWERRNARLSAFSVVGGVIDLWPWLFGFGFALPVFGALVGAQIGMQVGAGGTRASSTARGPERGPEQSIPHQGHTLRPEIALENPPENPNTPPPPPPETWSWNAKPAARTPSARPKPPAVESPNATLPSDH
jgi:hypothetical protein